MRRNSEIHLIPLTDADVALVEGWLGSKHGRRWFPYPEGVIGDLHDPNCREQQRIIRTDEERVGYLHWEEVIAAEWLAAGLNVPEGAIDIDILIGEEKNRGLGIGSAAVTRLVDELHGQVLVATTLLRNLACRRAFQKCGFLELQQFHESDVGRMVLTAHWPPDGSWEQALSVSSGRHRHTGLLSPRKTRRIAIRSMASQDHEAYHSIPAGLPPPRDRGGTLGNGGPRGPCLV